MRAMPNIVVIDPCDATETAQATQAIAEFDGPVYMRLLRGQVPVVLDSATYQFEIGKAKLLRDAVNVAIISTGLMTGRALEASAELCKNGIGAAVPAREHNSSRSTWPRSLRWLGAWATW